MMGLLRGMGMMSRRFRYWSSRAVHHCIFYSLNRDMWLLCYSLLRALYCQHAGLTS